MRRFPSNRGASHGAKLTGRERSVFARCFSPNRAQRTSEGTGRKATWRLGRELPERRNHSVDGCEIHFAPKKPNGRIRFPCKYQTMVSTMVLKGFCQFVSYGFPFVSYMVSHNFPKLCANGFGPPTVGILAEGQSSALRAVPAHAGGPRVDPRQSDFSVQAKAKWRRAFFPLFGCWISLKMAGTFDVFVLDLPKSGGFFSSTLFMA